MPIISLKGGRKSRSLLVGNVAYIPAVRGVFAGGNDGVTGALNVIDYINISSTGNATDFGDLTNSRLGAGACSGAHGGLQ